MGLGYGIRKKPIPDPGVKEAPDPGSGSATLVCARMYACMYRNMLLGNACFWPPGSGYINQRY